jgi:hypothetical protein
MIDRGKGQGEVPRLIGKRARRGCARKGKAKERCLASETEKALNFLPSVTFSWIMVL